MNFRVYQKHLFEISWENSKQFSQNEKRTPKWAQKYQKKTQSRGENNVKISVTTIIVLSHAGLDMNQLIIW